MYMFSKEKIYIIVLKDISYKIKSTINIMSVYSSINESHIFYWKNKMKNKSYHFFVYVRVAT